MVREDFPQPFDFNRWYASTYDHDAVNIAYRFWDLDNSCDYALLSCQWHVKNNNGYKPDPVFSVEEILAASKKEGWTPDPCARVIHSQWVAYCRWKEEKDPPIVITPPPPNPPEHDDAYDPHPNMPHPPTPKPEPKLPEVRVPQPKKNPNPNLVRFSVYFSALAGVAGIVSWFIPGAKPYVMAVVAIIKGILTALGV